MATYHDYSTYLGDGWVSIQYAYEAKETEIREWDSPENSI